MSEREWRIVFRVDDGKDVLEIFPPKNMPAEATMTLLLNAVESHHKAMLAAQQSAHEHTLHRLSTY